MAFFNRSLETIASEGLQQLATETNITQLSPGAKARFVIDTFSREQANQYQTFDTNLAQAFIKYADDRFLDFFGDILQLPRLQASHAEDDGENFYFYVSTGVFGDINAGEDFVIPANTIVSTVPIEGTVVTPGIEEQPIIEYKTTEAVIAEADQSIVFAPVRATIEGRSAIIPRNVLNRHSFVNYTSVAQNRLKCSNKFAIQNGTEREAGSAYKFRLMNAFRSKSMAIRIAIRLAALSVSGVSDINDVLCEQGPGSVSIYVKGLTPTTGPRLLLEVAEAVNSVTGWGNRIFVFAPVPLGLEFIAQVNWAPKATATQRAEGYAAMRRNVEMYLNEIDVGQEVFFEEIVGVILSSSPYALSLGTLEPNKFDQVFVHRQDPRKAEATIKSLIYGPKITPLYNERVILETSGKYRGIRFR